MNNMSDHDAHLSLTDTVRIIREADLKISDDSLEATQRMTPVQKNLARQQAVSLHFGRLSYEAQRAGVVVEERPVYPHDFRDLRPRGDLTEMQKAMQDLKGNEDY